MEFVYNDMSAQVSMAQYINDCVDVPRIINGCQGCKNYFKLWSCPPFGFDPAKIWRDYSKLTLYARKISFPKELTEKTFDADGLAAQYFEIWNKERRKFFIELMEREQSTPGSFMLAAGCCDECTICARANGAPCIKPDRLRYSIESLGGDVEKTLELYFNERLLWGREGHMPEYMLIVGGLMQK